MSTTPEAAARAAIPRWWTAIETAQATYGTLATDPTWSPAKLQAELAAASDLARMYDALSNELTGPLATAVRHARNHLDHQVAELDRHLTEDFCDEDFEGGPGEATDATPRPAAVPACPGCTQGHEIPGRNGAVITLHDVDCTALPAPGSTDDGLLASGVDHNQPPTSREEP